jgi:hypothetical protein
LALAITLRAFGALETPVVVTTDLSREMILFIILCKLNSQY